MAKPKFKITPFTNPSGQSVYRLSGTLNGKRIRENCATRPEAVTKRQEYGVEWLNDHPEGRTIWRPEKTGGGVWGIVQGLVHRSEEGKTELDGRKERKGVEWKLALGVWLKAQSGVKNRWLAERLNMSHPQTGSRQMILYKKQRIKECPYTERLRNTSEWSA